jgi:hypothetical protein
LGQRQAERLANDLRGGGRAQELTTTARARTGLTTEFGGLLEGYRAMGEARADGLDLARVFAVLGW